MYTHMKMVKMVILGVFDHNLEKKKENTKTKTQAICVQREKGKAPQA